MKPASSPHDVHSDTLAPAGEPIFAGTLCKALSVAFFLALFGLNANARQVEHSSADDRSMQSLRQLSLEQLGNIRVTTYNKTPTELWHTPAAVYILSRQEILRSGVTTIADALRLVPGVEVGRMASNSWAIGIRGLQNNFSKSVLVLVDGRSLYSPLFAGTYWDIVDLPLRDIDRIEVIRGPGGTIWGPNAANGVINIVTRSAAQTQGVTADTLAGNQERTIDDFQFGSSAHDIHYRLYGRGFDRAPEYHYDRINDDAWHQERLGFRADRASGSDSWFIEGGSYRGDSPRILGTKPFDDEVSGGSLNFRWERNQPSGNGLYVQAYFARTLRTHDPLGETRNTAEVDFLQHFHAPGRQQISYGGTFRWSPYRIISTDPSDTILPERNTDSLLTLFGQDELQLRPNLTLTGGLKLEENNYSGIDLQPSLRLLLLARPHQALWGGITRAVTTPSDLEEGQYIHVGGPSVYLQLLGNRRFMSEDVLGYEAGYRGLVSGRFYIDLSTFWNQYAHLQSFSARADIPAAPGVTDVTIQYENRISGSTSGFEIAPQISILPRWRLNVGYSFLSSVFSVAGAASDISSSGSVNTYEHSTPKHMVFAQSIIDLPLGISFDQSFRFSSALPAQKVPSYETMDLHLAKKLGSRLMLEVVGQNLFQPRHVEWGTGDPTQPDVGIERAAYASLIFRSRAR